MPTCKTHCPQAGDSLFGLLVLALVTLGALVAVAMFAVAYAMVLVPGVLVIAAVVVASQRWLKQRMGLVLPWRREPARATVRVLAASPVRALSAPPLAIEARHVIPAVVISSETEEARR